MSARAIAAALAAAMLPAAALAQADPATLAATERVKAEAELEKARADRARAEADRVKALGLPSFEGKAELGDNAGVMETTLLAGRALGAAAARIGADGKIASYPSLLVLTLAETLDLGQAAALELEMAVIAALFDDAGVDPAPDRAMLGGGAGAIAAISAVAGLLRSDASLSGFDIAAIDDRMLAWAVAGKLGGRAILPSAAIAGGPGTQAAALFARLDALVVRRSAAEKARGTLADVEDPGGADKARLAALDAAAARHDAFVARVTTPAANGAVPIITAGRMADLLGTGVPVLRLHIDKAGGSLVNTKNLATTFGVDPLKVSGALVASYLLTDPESGSVLGSDVIACHTTLTSIRGVQERRWSVPGDRYCASLMDGSP